MNTCGHFCIRDLFGLDLFWDQSEFQRVGVSVQIGPEHQLLTAPADRVNVERVWNCLSNVLGG